MKKCKQCKLPSDKWLIPPRNSLQAVCSPSCAREYAKILRLRKEAQNARKTRKEAKDKLKTRSDWIKEAQTAFNTYIRKRDEKLPCISCGRPVHWNGQWHASHYYATSIRPNLRFNEDNVHKSCSICNNYKHGNLIPYREALIAKIGLDAVERLDSDQTPKKYSASELQEIKAKYVRLTKELKVQN